MNGRQGGRQTFRAWRQVRGKERGETELVGREEVGEGEEIKGNGVDRRAGKKRDLPTRLARKELLPPKSQPRRRGLTYSLARADFRRRSVAGARKAEEAEPAKRTESRRKTENSPKYLETAPRGLGRGRGRRRGRKEVRKEGGDW